MDGVTLLVIILSCYHYSQKIITILGYIGCVWKFWRKPKKWWFIITMRIQTAILGYTQFSDTATWRYQTNHDIDIYDIYVLQINEWRLNHLSLCHYVYKIVWFLGMNKSWSESLHPDPPISRTPRAPRPRRNLPDTRFSVDIPNINQWKTSWGVTIKNGLIHWDHALWSFGK